MISQEMLEKYKTIYQNKFGKAISDQEVLEQAAKLITLVKAVYKPMTKEEFKQLEKRRKEI